MGRHRSQRASARSNANKKLTRQKINSTQRETTIHWHQTPRITSLDQNIFQERSPIMHANESERICEILQPQYMKIMVASHVVYFDSLLEIHDLIHRLPVFQKYPA